jgi:hypothetical protein
MKPTLIIVAIILLGLLLWFRKSNKSLDKAPNNFVKLDSEKESTTYLPKVPAGFLQTLERKYPNQEFKTYPNEYTDQSMKLCNDIYSNSKYWELEKTHAEFINELTKEQRIYFTLINFESQVNNGGVYQFLFNYPELSIIALESMKITKMDKLAGDYEKVLNEYFGKFKTIQELYSKFQNENSDWDKRWNAFAEGYKELKTTLVIENYFYEENFKKDFQNKMILFVKQHKDKLLIEE